MIRRVLLQQENFDKTALIDGTDHWSYRDLAGKACALCSMLTLKTVPNTAYLLSAGFDSITALFGILMAGGTAIPVSPYSTAYEIEPLLSQTKTSVLISTKNFQPVLKKLPPSLEIIYIEDVPAEKEFIMPDLVQTDKNLPMLLLRTSGTTDSPKLVMLSEQNFDYYTNDYLDRMSDTQYAEGNIRYLLGTPLASVYGLFILFIIMTKGFTAVLMPEPVTPDRFFHTIEQHGITHYEGGAAAAVLLEQGINRQQPYDISSARYFCFGGSGVTEETMQRLHEAYPFAEFWTGYGLTEFVTITKPFRFFPKNKWASVGIAGKNSVLMIEKDGRKTTHPFEQGEIIVKSPGNMLGYYKNESAAKEVLREGWLHTGDLGYLDEDQYLYLCGRLKNIILVKGMTVFAEEVESCIMGSKLAESCMVYSEPDILGNEQVCADVVPKNETIHIEDIRNWCHTRLAEYKQPQKIQFISQIPKTETGKIKRKRKARL